MVLDERCKGKNSELSVNRNTLILNCAWLLHEHKFDFINILILPHFQKNCWFLLCIDYALYPGDVIKLLDFSLLTYLQHFY